MVFKHFAFIPCTLGSLCLIYLECLVFFEERFVCFSVQMKENENVGKYSYLNKESSVCHCSLLTAADWKTRGLINSNNAERVLVADHSEISDVTATHFHEIDNKHQTWRNINGTLEASGICLWVSTVTLIASSHFLLKSLMQNTFDCANNVVAHCQKNCRGGKMTVCTASEASVSQSFVPQMVALVGEKPTHVNTQHMCQCVYLRANTDSDSLFRELHCFSPNACWESSSSLFVQIDWLPLLPLWGCWFSLLQPVPLVQWYSHSVLKGYLL